MRYPSIEEYTDALSRPAREVLTDPDLVRAEVRRGGSGLPLARGGGPTLTYELLTDQRRFALRCFQKAPDASLAQRYASICRELERIRSPYFVNCRFIEEGIRTESGVYPVVMMDWAQGESLSSYVWSHRRDAAALHALRTALRKLAQHLSEHGIAHGDLQPGNLLVDDQQQLRLVDYDGMFIPELRGMRSLQLGHDNFRHPARSPEHFDEGMDRFPFCVLDLALRALSQRPSLWDVTASDAQTLLFRARDFADPTGSQIFRLLDGMTEVRRWSEVLVSVCGLPYAATPSLEQFLTGTDLPQPSRENPARDDAALRSPAQMSPAVDATDFAQCCKCIGERVELIGRIVRITSQPADGAPPHDRIDFGATPLDLICLRIEPGVLQRLENVSGPSLIGQWVSAIGLIEPVRSGGTGEDRYKDLSLQISEAVQLRRLSPAQARERLEGSPGTSVAQQPGGSGYAQGTTPVEPVAGETSPASAAAFDGDAAAPMQPFAAAIDGTLEPTDQPRPKARSRWALGSLVAVLTGLAGLALGTLIGRNITETELQESPTGSDRAAPVAPAQAAEGERRATTATPVPEPSRATTLLAMQSLDRRSEALSTRYGELRIVTDPDSGGMKLLRLGTEPVPGITGRRIELVHRAEFPDREVVVVFTDCTATGANCGALRPTWLVLQANAEPIVKSTLSVLSRDGGAVTSLDTGVHVELGVLDGSRRTALLTYRNDVFLTRLPEPRVPLNRNSCRTVIRSLERCAASRDCESLPSSASRLDASQRRELRRIFHETTGFDAPAFAVLCQRSCELGITPSAAFVRTNLCNGSPPTQWLERSLDWLDAE